MARTRRARRNGRSATSPTSSRCGSRSCASSVATARWCARMRPSARGTTTIPCWRRRRPRFRLRRSPGAASRTCATRCRWRSRTARGASSASRPVPCAVRKRRASGPSTWRRRRPILARERANLAFFDALPDNKPMGLDATLVRGAQYLDPALRVLRRLRGLRRDALPEAPHAALRRSAARRQRDRVFLDLRRQPADDALVGEQRGPRAGLGELALRGQRRVRAGIPRLARHAASRGRAAARRAGAGARSGPRVRELLEAPQTTQAEIDAQRDRVAALEADAADAERSDARAAC